MPLYQKAKKRFGQHFLIDPVVISSIIQATNLKPEESILEIGCGHGDLTIPLLKAGVFVTGVEIDRDLIAPLKVKCLPFSKFELIEKDILRIDWKKEIIKDKKKWKIVSNLPYNITSPLFFYLLPYRNFFSSITIMIQKEVASRFLHKGETKPFKNYGILSVIAQNLFDVTWICDVPASSFQPIPKVDSTIIQMIPKQIYLEREHEFFQFIQVAFSYRRKLLIKQLKMFMQTWFNTLEPNIIKKLEGKRAENLTPAQYKTLFYDSKM